MIQELQKRVVKKLQGRVVELRGVEAAKGFIKRKAETEFARMLVDVGGHSENIQGLSKDVLDLVNEWNQLELIDETVTDLEVKNDSIVDGIKEEDEGGDGVGFGSLFETESHITTVNSSSVSTLPSPRHLKIPSSWTGKSAKNLLQEHVIKRARQAKFKYIKESMKENGYIATLKIEGSGVTSSSLGGASLVYSLDLIERVDNYKMAEELVAVSLCIFCVLLYLTSISILISSIDESFALNERRIKLDFITSSLSSRYLAGMGSKRS